MGVLVPVERIGSVLEVKIPDDIIPEEYKVVTEKRPETQIVEGKTYVYRGRGPRLEEGLFEAIREAGRRYGVGVRFSLDFVEEMGRPVSLKLVRIYYPPIPYVRRTGVTVDVVEEPKLTLRPVFDKGRLVGWRVAIPNDIVRKYSLYAFPDRHPLSIYNPTLYLEWTTYKPVSVVREKLRVYHVGDYYDAWWDADRKKWIWRIPPNTPCFEAAMTGINVGAAPSAQCFFEDGVVYIDLIFSPWGAKVVSRQLGYAYRSMVVRSYTLKKEFSEYKTEQCDIEIRVTFVTPCPVEFYQSDMTHMKVVTETEKGALNITCWNVIRYFGREAIKKGYYYSPLESAAYSEKMKETVGVENNEYVDFQEVKDDRFFYVNKYVRIDKTSRGKRKRHVYTTREIDRRIVEAGGIVDEKGFVWGRHV